MSYMTFEMAVKVLDAYKSHKEKHIDPKTGLARPNAPMFDYTSVMFARRKLGDTIVVLEGVPLNG